MRRSALRGPAAPGHECHALGYGQSRSRLATLALVPPVALLAASPRAPREPLCGGSGNDRLGGGRGRRQPLRRPTGAAESDDGAGGLHQLACVRLVGQAVGGRRAGARRSALVTFLTRPPTAS